MITWTSLLYILATFVLPQNTAGSDSELAYCDFSKIKPGRFGDYSEKGFPEYHYVPRHFTDGWDIVNNRGPEEWIIVESDGKHSLQYLGYNNTVWTSEFIYPILCYGDLLWKDYTLEVTLTPADRSDL